MKNEVPEAHSDNNDLNKDVGGESEELELLKESRRLGTVDLEDPGSHLLGSGSLAGDGHAEEYSLSAVGGEDLLMMGEEEEDYDEEEAVEEKKSRKSRKHGGNVSSSSSWTIQSAHGQKVSGIWNIAIDNPLTLGIIPQETETHGEEQEEMVGSTSIEEEGSFESTGNNSEDLPELWTVDSVCAYLTENDRGAYCDSFRKHKVDGAKFLRMSKDDIITVLGMKVGPALKIFDLIAQLRDRMDPVGGVRRK